MDEQRDGEGNSRGERGQGREGGNTCGEVRRVVLGRQARRGREVDKAEERRSGKKGVSRSDGKRGEQRGGCVW